VTPLFSIKLSYLISSMYSGFFHLEYKNQDLLIIDCSSAINKKGYFRALIIEDFSAMSLSTLKYEVITRKQVDYRNFL
jgi:hypothetical protein